MKLKLLIVFLSLSMYCSAACTGSGTAWSCAAGSTLANVASALGSASDGAVITFASGSYTWTSGSAPFSSAKGATLICAGTCNVTASGSILGMSSWSGTVTKLYRISGFNFTVSGSSTLLIWFGSGGGVTGTLTQVRIDHNTFAMAATDIAIVLGENTSSTYVYGVADHNTFTSAGSIEALYMLGKEHLSPPANALGTGNNFFFEDNTLVVTTMTDGGLGAMDGWSCEMNVVFRHNVITNSLVTAHGVTHGDGPCNVEVYNNSLIANANSTYTDGYRLFHHQGAGTMMVFNNSFTASSGKNGSAFSLLHYRDYPNGSDGVLPADAAQCNGTVSGPADQPEMIDGNRATTATNRGYPCFNQPGRDMFGNYKPIYSWNNAWSDTGAIVPLNDEDLGGAPDYKAQHMQANRDWYDAVSASAQSNATTPFNGTTGMGYGTLARRPTTCTTNATEAGGGVGYFATDSGSQGTLYACSATNTWSVYYTPFTYPHPLVSGGGGGVSAPTSLSGTVNYNVALSCSPSGTPGSPTFSIYKGTSSGGETLLTSGLSSCSYTDTAVSPSTTYFYKATETIAGVESPASNETSDTLPAASSCFLPNLLCAYNGVDIVQWGTIPNFGGLTNNNAVSYDTSFLGHTMFDGVPFTSGVCPGVWCNLSQLTRLTDSVSATVSATKSCAAGIGGSGEFTVVNTNTTLVGVDCNSLEYIGLFNPSGGNIGHFTPVNSGVFITTDLCQAGNLCTVGLSSQTQDFGSITFSQTDPSIVFNFGGNSFDVTSAYDGLTVFPYQINYAANTPIPSAPIGAYKLLPGIVDFKFGLPQSSAVEWNNATGYSFGNYVIHTLTAGEMATSGVWATAHLYALGDIVVAQGGTAACMYRVITAGGVNTSGSSPAFVNSPPCNDNQSNLTDAAGNVWRGTNGLAQFLYQNTNTACTLGSPCTSAASFSIGGGNHPDLLSTVTEGANATKNIWVNTGPAYVPASANQEWTAVAGVSSDCSYIVSGHCFPSKYGIAISTNTYGDNLAGGGYTKYKGGQGTGVDVVLYDATTNAFQHLNTLTGIWNTYTCGTGNGFSCGSITSTTVGTAPLAEIADPFGTGQNCPFFIHNAKNNTLGTFDRVTDQQNVYSACDTGIANSSHGRIWNMNPAAYNTSVTAPGSLQAMFSGIAHDAIDTTEFLSAHGASAIPGAANGGWFTEVYQVGSAAAQPATSVYMTPNVNLPGSGLFPTGCETNGTNPDCNLADFMDQHISCVGGCDHGALHACGTTYNYATFSPVAFNAWQNMETCYSTGTLFQVGSLPSTSAGQVSQFTHTFATGTSAYFPTQFQISEWSQDGNWLFFSSDYACQLGSTTGAAPTVYLSGANHVGFLAKAYSGRSPLPPTSATSLCGLPWLSGISYQVGNTINPLEVTSVAGGADDVFQAIASCSSGTCQTTSGTGGGLSGPSGQPGGSNNQPACVIGGVNKSCFANTNAPTASAAGDTVCDNQNFNGTGSPVTGSQLNSINPSLPYSTSCPNGVVWQDLGPANALGEVFAVQVAGFGVSLSPPILRVVGGGHRIGSGHVIP